MTVPDCSPCGLSVEWLRGAYKSRWRLFKDSPVETPGRYYRSPPDAPFVQGFHQFGSRTWDDKNFPADHPLGEVGNATQSWDRGDPPPVLPGYLQVGGVSCFPDGDLIENALPADQVVNGFNAACFLPAVEPDLGWAILSNWASCSLQFFYARIISWLYDGQSTLISQAFNLLLPSVTTSYFPGTDLLPDVVVAVTSKAMAVVIDGTRNFQQLATQAFQSIVGPTNMGAYSTLPLWYDASSWVFAKMTEAGVSPLLPVIFVGHSYGACAAMNCAARWRLPGPNRRIACLTYGAPKPGDQRMQDLIFQTSCFGLVNDFDFTGAIPPDLITLAPVEEVLGLRRLLVWTQWIRQANSNLQDVAGMLTPNQFPVLDYPTLLAFTLDAINNLPLPPILPHGIDVYASRIVTRCPRPEWPVSDALWRFLLGARKIAGGVLVGGAAVGPPLPAPAGGVEVGGAVAATGPGAPAGGVEVGGQVASGGPGAPAGGVEVGGQVASGGPGAPAGGVEVGGSVPSGGPGIPGGGVEAGGELGSGGPGAPAGGVEVGGAVSSGDPGEPGGGVEAGGAVP